MPIGVDLHRSMIRRMKEFFLTKNPDLPLEEEEEEEEEKAVEDLAEDQQLGQMVG
jgi:hypothetical protein